MKRSVKRRWIPKVVLSILLGTMILMAGCSRNEEAATSEGSSEDESSEGEIEESVELTEEEEPRSIFVYGVPYMFLDENSYFHPERGVTSHDVKNALLFLLADQNQKLMAIEHLPEGGKMSLQGVRALFSEIVPEEILDEVFVLDQQEKVPEGAAPKALTRMDFALLIDQLLKKTAEHSYSFEVSDYPRIPVDIWIEDVEMAPVFRAIFSYRVVEGEEDAETAVRSIFNCKWQSGQHMSGGYLYCADEDGHLLCNEYQGTHLYFDEKGRFTSGSGELDLVVSGMLKEITCENPGMTPFEWLRVAFDQIVHTTSYLAGGVHEFGDNCNNEWYIPTAIDTLEMGLGNCYGFASAYTALARGLGFDAHCISGSALDRNSQHHSWCMLRGESGEFGIHDPQLAWRCDVAHQRNNAGQSMFDLDIKISSTWAYRWRAPETKTCLDWTVYSEE